MSHAVYSHVLTGTNPCINKAIHMLLMHGFAVLRISIPRPSQKLTSSSVMCTVAMTLVFALEAIFKTFAGNVLFRAIIGTGKKKLFEAISPNFSSKKMYSCNNTDQTCFSDTLTSARPPWKVSGFSTSLGAQQMLMHKKNHV